MQSGAPQSGVGRVIAGRYLLLNRLGSGGMGHVWLAHDQQTGLRGRAQGDRVPRPGRGRATSAPPGSPAPAPRPGTPPGCAATRMWSPCTTSWNTRACRGSSWSTWRAPSTCRTWSPCAAPLAPAECARIGLAVLDALTAGHERGIMHRDVKPANILLAPDRTGSPYARVLLTDYGISVQPDAAGDPVHADVTSLVGTAGYLAPERATGRAADRRRRPVLAGLHAVPRRRGRTGPSTATSELAALTAVVLEEPRPMLRAGALEPVLGAMLAKDPCAGSPPPRPRRRCPRSSRPRPTPVPSPTWVRSRSGRARPRTRRSRRSPASSPGSRGGRRGTRRRAGTAAQDRPAPGRTPVVRRPGPRPPATDQRHRPRPGRRCRRAPPSARAARPSSRAWPPPSVWPCWPAGPGTP